MTEETAAVSGSCGAGEGLLVTKVYLMPAEQFKSTLTKHVGINF